MHGLHAVTKYEASSVPSTCSGSSHDDQASVYTGSDMGTHAMMSDMYLCCTCTCINRLGEVQYMLRITCHEDRSTTQMHCTVEPLYNGHHWEPTFCPL